MNRLLALAAALVVSACASDQAAMKSAAAPLPWCNPCTYPCASPCAPPAAKVAAAPAKPPYVPPPVPALSAVVRSGARRVHGAAERDAVVAHARRGHPLHHRRQHADGRVAHVFRPDPGREVDDHPRAGRRAARAGELGLAGRVCDRRAQARPSRRPPLPRRPPHRPPG